MGMEKIQLVINPLEEEIKRQELIRILASMIKDYAFKSTN